MIRGWPFDHCLSDSKKNEQEEDIEEKENKEELMWLFGHFLVGTPFDLFPGGTHYPF